MTPRSARVTHPAAVEAFAEALAEWLSSFTVPQELAAEMASACSAGAPWAAALAGTSARRAGWPEREALAWGVAIGACAGALEAGKRSLAGDSTLARPKTAPPRAADGPALPLLTADGLIAAAHEAIASLEPERLLAGMDALGRAFGDGGPWRYLDARWPRPAWPAVVACGLDPAAATDPDGPWTDLAEAWRSAFAAPPVSSPKAEAAGAARVGNEGLADHPAADQDTNELFAAAARAARLDSGESDDDERF